MSDTLNNHQFRVALHGFNREDVVAFIDRLTLDHEKELRVLQDANARLKSDLEQSNALLAQAKEDSGAKDALLQAQMELNNANTEIDRLREVNDRLRDEISTLEKQLEERPVQPAAQSAQPALTAPIPPIQEVVPAAPAPQRDYSELELAAYRRAEVTERLARERAQDVYRQVRAVFSNAASKFDTGKNDLDQVTKTLQMDVNQLLQLLANIRGAYTEAELSFQAVSEKNRQMAEGEL